MMLKSHINKLKYPLVTLTYIDRLSYNYVSQMVARGSDHIKVDPGEDLMLLFRL